MRRVLTIMAMAALAVAATNCAKRVRANGPATGDGIPVGLDNASTNDAATDNGTAPE